MRLGSTLDPDDGMALLCQTCRRDQADIASPIMATRTLGPPQMIQALDENVTRLGGCRRAPPIRLPGSDTQNRLDR